jgi:2-polyprenyl-3-methyl-5-hydroxy-6-metoxy-1,4-benzoquinol methylase
MLMNKPRSMVLEQRPREALGDFLNDYCSLMKVDSERAFNLIKQGLSFHQADKRTKKYNPFLYPAYLKTLENSWYNSLDAGNPNYEIYNDDYYFTDMWICWISYSRNYIRSFIKDGSVTKGKSVYQTLDDNVDIQRVLDLGCGIGYTTSALTEIYPNAEIIGTNLSDTKQFRYCKHRSEKYKFNIISDIDMMNSPVDLVVASEYFEHIENPVEHLDSIIQKLAPKCFYIANSFNTHSLGHFNSYKHQNHTYSQSVISRGFNSFLKDQGYHKLKTNIWNNKPTLWIKR